MLPCFPIIKDYHLPFHDVDPILLDHHHTNAAKVMKVMLSRGVTGITEKAEVVVTVRSIILQKQLKLHEIIVQEDIIGDGKKIGVATVSATAIAMDIVV